MHGEFLSPLKWCKPVRKTSIKTYPPPHTHAHRLRKKFSSHKWKYLEKKSKSSKLSVLSPSRFFFFLFFFSYFSRESSFDFLSHPWHVRVSSSYSSVRAISLQWPKYFLCSLNSIKLLLFFSKGNNLTDTKKYPIHWNDKTINKYKSMIMWVAFGAKQTDVVMVKQNMFLDNRKFVRKEKQWDYEYSPSLISSFLFGCELIKDNRQSAFRKIQSLKELQNKYFKIANWLWSSSMGFFLPDREMKIVLP